MPGDPDRGDRRAREAPAAARAAVEVRVRGGDGRPLRVEVRADDRELVRVVDDVACPSIPDVVAAFVTTALAPLSGALAAYRSIRSGLEAEDARYATARLLLGPIGHADAAHRAFLEYRRHHPDGRYARAVDLHILDHLASRDRATALREADAFLAAHAADPLAPRVRLIRAELLRRRR